jgi:hypothetical protein
MRGIAILVSKKLFLRTDRIPKVCLFSHLHQKRLVLASTLVLLCLTISYKAQSRNSVLISDQDIAETIDAFKTADVARSVEGFKKAMPAPVVDPKLRQGILDNLPAYVGKLRLNNDSLIQKIKQLIAPVLSLYKRENVYDLIIVQHPTPLVMSDSGVVIVITTGLLYVRSKVGLQVLPSSAEFSPNWRTSPLGSLLKVMRAKVFLPLVRFSAT